MKRLRQILPALLLPALASPAAAPVSDIGTLVQAKNANALDTVFDITATLTYNSRVRGDPIVIQDGTNAISLWYHAPAEPNGFKPGDRVRAIGLIRRGQSGGAAIDCTNLHVLATGSLPEVRAVSPKDLSQGDFGLSLVRTQGTVVDVIPDEIDRNWMYFALVGEGTTFFAAMRSPGDITSCERYVGADVTVVGQYYGKRRTVKDAITIDSTNALTVIRRRPSDSTYDVPDVDDFGLTVDPSKGGMTQRRAIGTVLAVWSDNHVLLKTDGGRLVKGVLAKGRLPAPGKRINLVGFPETDLYTVILVRSVWRDECGPAEPTPTTKSIGAEQLMTDETGRKCFNIRYQGQNVSLCGVVCSLPTGSGDNRLYLESDGRIIAVDTGCCRDAVDALRPGYTVNVCGVCVMETERTGLNFVMPRINGVLIVPREPKGIRVIARPSWWTPVLLLTIIGMLFLGLIGFTIWNLLLHRLVEKRSGALLTERLARTESELRIGERTRLAVELHDTLSQNLTGAAMEINTAEELVGEDTAETRRHLALATKTLRSCRNELRACLWDLRSQALESGDMNEAIRKAIEPYVADTRVVLRFNVPRATFTDNTAHALLRIIRELVTNAIRHGHAKSIRIAGSRENGRLLFSVRDDGCGFDPETVPGIPQGHFGLQGIRERLRMLQGKMAVESSCGAGAKVTVSFELPRETGEKV